MTSDQYTVYNFQAEVYINRTQDNITLLRTYADPASIAVARNLEDDLNQFKKEMGYISPLAKVAEMGVKYAVTHTANPDGTTTAHPFGMTRPELTNVSYVMKKAAKEAAKKMRTSKKGLRVA